MSVSLRLTKKEEQTLKQYAAVHGLSVSEVIRQAIFEKIEDEFDLMVAEKALSEYRADPKTYSLEEVIKMVKDK
jgi:RHH-type transcriptional regulator, rel operon repressor / antitoxin RelB